MSNWSKLAFIPFLTHGNIRRSTWHNENSKMFDDFSCHLELESTCLEVAKAHGSTYVVEGISHKGLSPKCRNFRKLPKRKIMRDLSLTRQRTPSTSTMRSAKLAEHVLIMVRKLNLHSWLPKPKRVLPNLDSRSVYVPNHVMVVHSSLDWIVV